MVLHKMEPRYYDTYVDILRHRQMPLAYGHPTLCTRYDDACRVVEIVLKEA